jgi:hypothetical protein
MKKQTPYRKYKDLSEVEKNNTLIHYNDGDDNGSNGGSTSGKKEPQKYTCGNDVCESWLGENEFNCWEDCKKDKKTFAFSGYNDTEIYTLDK